MFDIFLGFCHQFIVYQRQQQRPKAFWDEPHAYQQGQILDTVVLYIRRLVSAALVSPEAGWGMRMHMGVGVEYAVRYYSRLQ